MTTQKKRLIIISAGAFSREVRVIASDIAATAGASCPWEFAGFLDDRLGILQDKNADGARIIGDPSNYQPQEEDFFICAIGNPSLKKQYSEIIRSKNGKFATLIEPFSRVASSAEIGDGTLIGPFCVVSCDLTIGADTMIPAHATLGHDVQIGLACHIGAYAFLGGGVILGNEVTIHPHATFARRHFA